MRKFDVKSDLVDLFLKVGDDYAIEEVVLEKFNPTTHKRVIIENVGQDDAPTIYSLIGMLRRYSNCEVEVYCNCSKKDMGVFGEISKYFHNVYLITKEKENEDKN